VDEQKLDANATKNIRNIFLMVGKLASRLWTSNMWPEVVDSRTLLGVVVASNGLMMRHPIVNLGGGEESLTEREVRLVVHPLLLIYGTEDGNKYDDFRVLMPAEVWCPDSVMQFFLTGLPRDVVAC
jgi:hypothetical protein